MTRMDLNELIDKRKSLLNGLETLVSNGKAEKRSLSDEEVTSVSSFTDEIKKLDDEIEQKRSGKTEKNNNIKMTENFSLIKSIRNIVEGQRFDEATIEMLDKGKREFAQGGLSYRGGLILPMEYRSEILAGTANQGQEIVTEQKLNLIGALRANSVLVQAGAQLITNLTGDVSIPVYAGSNVNWSTETGAAADGAGAFSEITLSPKRLTAYIDISKSFLLQDTIGAEQLLINDLANAITVKLENTLLGTASGNTTQPAGLFYSPSYTFTGTTTWAGIVSLESAVNTNNALTGNLTYLVHPSTVGVAKTTPKVASTSIFIAESGTINGYKYFTTSNLPTVNSDQKACLFGNFSDFVIGQWGGLDITVDPYSQAVNGKVRIIINTYWDGKSRRDVSFAKAGLK